jgi:hypothetical protein
MTYSYPRLLEIGKTRELRIAIIWSWSGDIALNPVRGAVIMLYDIFAVVDVVTVLGTVLWVVWSMTRV